MDKNEKLIDGILFSPAKKINHENGDIFHIIRNFDEGFKCFGEAYISNIKYNEIKAWKRHFQMTSNMVVPSGIVKIVIFDDRSKSSTHGMFNEFILSPKNYFRLTIPPNLLYGFMGLEKSINMIINIADIPHDPIEQINYKKDYINYKW
jgi:dTDP-4-dehydrorhamnose 3,5-epimerase